MANHSLSTALQNPPQSVLTCQRHSDLCTDRREARSLGHRRTQAVLSPLALGDVGHRPDKLDVAGWIVKSVGPHVEVLDCPAWYKQTILVFEVCAALGYVLDDLLCERPVLRMYAP